MSISRRKHNGKQQYRAIRSWTDENGKRRQASSGWFNTLREAKEAYEDLAEPAKAVPTFGEAAAAYIEHRAQHNTEQTTAVKKRIVRLHYHMIKDRPVDTITPAVLKDCYSDPEFQKLATVTKNSIRSLASSVFRYAIVFMNVAMANPVDAIPVWKKTSEEELKEQTVYTPEQFQRFLDAIPAKYENIRRLFYVLYWTGMRYSEANSLTFNDVDDSFIHVRRQFINGKWCKLKTRESRRDIAIDKDIHNVIEEAREFWKQMQGFSDEWFIFGGVRPIHHSTPDRVKNIASEKAGLPFIRIHDFRHSHASNLIEAGVNIYKISKRLGHSSITITMDRYGHLLDRDETEILSAMRNKRAVTQS